jgi:hypothetical protein
MHGSRLSFDVKIDLLCCMHQIRKPCYRCRNSVTHPETRETCVFYAGKFLQLLGTKLRDGTAAPASLLTEEQLEKLESLCWFHEWIEMVQSNHRQAASAASQVSEYELGLDERVALFCKAYNHTREHLGGCATVRRPAWATALAERTVETDLGLQYKVNGMRFMEKIASTWFSDGQLSSQGPQQQQQRSRRQLALNATQRAKIESMPWFQEWKAESIARRRVAFMRTLVSKEDKLKLLEDHYGYTKDGSPKGKPLWSDRIKVVRQREPPHHDIEWEFRPATFLDDLIDNWSPIGRPGVTLSAEQMNRVVLKLPWAKDWLDGVFAARKRRCV